MLGLCFWGPESSFHLQTGWGLLPNSDSTVPDLELLSTDKCHPLLSSCRGRKDLWEVQKGEAIAIDDAAEGKAALWVGLSGAGSRAGTLGKLTALYCWLF